MSAAWIVDDGVYELWTDDEKLGTVQRHGAGRSHWDALLPDGTSTTVTSLSAAKALCEAWKPDSTLVTLTPPRSEQLGPEDAVYDDDVWDDDNDDYDDVEETGETDTPSTSGQDTLPVAAAAALTSESTDDELIAMLTALATILDGNTAPPKPHRYGTTSAGKEQQDALKAVRGLARLRRLVEQAVIVQVDESRRSGSSYYPNAATWELVGAALGVTKQSARTRYGVSKD